MSLPLTLFAASRMIVGALISLAPSLSSTMLLLPTTREAIFPLRLCGVREFVLGGLLYSTISAGSLTSKRHALIAGATVDALDFAFTLVSWKVTRDLDGMPAATIAMCAGVNLLLGGLYWRVLGGKLKI